MIPSSPMAPSSPITLSSPMTRGFAALILLSSLRVTTATPIPETVDTEKEAPASKPAAEKDLRFWLENMVWHHRFSRKEVAGALDTGAERVDELLEKFGIHEKNAPAAATSITGEVIKVLPYPGGRHPRIGFLDGAIDPHRDTKASFFLPWKDGGYVVADLPEALWSNLGLTYLAHTHIPTIWDKKKVRLERIDWTRKGGGVLESHRTLPNGIAFSARILPRKKSVDMELRLKNGTDEKLTGLRTQICILLKGAPDFNAQTRENKKIVGSVIGVQSRTGKRWIVTVWDRARPWSNPPCPCMHSDPVFPDLEAGEEAVVRGRLFFWEGEDLEAEIARRRRAGTLNW